MMKNEIQKSKDHNASQGKTQREADEEAYRQINSKSFQQCFKNLIGHYKQGSGISGQKDPRVSIN